MWIMTLKSSPLNSQQMKNLRIFLMNKDDEELCCLFFKNENCKCYLKSLWLVPQLFVALCI